MYRTKKRRIIYSLVFTFILILTAVTSFQLGIASVPASGTYYLDVPFGTADYYIGEFDNGTAYYVNGDDWGVDYYSNDKDLVINTVLQTASAFDKIVVSGNIQQLDETLVFNTNDITFIFESLYWNTADTIGINITASRVRIRGQTLYRGATPTNKEMILINGGGAHNIDIMQIYIEDGVAVKFTGHSYFSDVKINQILGCNIGIHFYATTGETIAHNLIQIGQINPASHACVGIRFQEHDTGIVARNTIFKTIFESTGNDMDVGYWNDGENILFECHTADLGANGKSIVNSGILQVFGGTYDTLDKITDTGQIEWTEVYFDGDNTWSSPQISPYRYYLPLAYRIDEEGLIYYNDPYIIIRLHNKTNHWISWLAFGKTFGYGQYEWKAYAENNETNCNLYIGGLEYHHGWFNEGIICVRWSGTEWRASTTWSGSETWTSLNDIDFTTERIITINWTSSYVEYWIDGILKANHTTNIPQQPMQLFAEVGIGASAPTTEPTVYFRNRSFKEIG